MEAPDPRSEDDLGCHWFVFLLLKTRSDFCLFTCGSDAGDGIFLSPVEQEVHVFTFSVLSRLGRHTHDILLTQRVA